MNLIKSIAIVATTVAVAASPAIAEECAGVNSRVGAAPVTVHKAEDGTTTLFVNSTGASTLMVPARLANTGWQHCSGFFITKEGTPPRGSGICYRVAQNGDRETVSWMMDGDTRTWKRESGTGSMSGAASGTWEANVPMGGMTIGAWKGDCEES